MIRRRLVPDVGARVTVESERDFRRVVQEHMHEVAENDRSFRARFVSGQVASTGTLAANGGATGISITGFNGTKARVLLTASGAGENGADPGAVEAWITTRSATGCTVNFRNTAPAAQSVTVDWLAVVPDA